MRSNKNIFNQTTITLAEKRKTVYREKKFSLISNKLMIIIISIIENQILYINILKHVYINKTKYIACIKQILVRIESKVFTEPNFQFRFRFRFLGVSC